MSSTRSAFNPSLGQKALKYGLPILVVLGCVVFGALVGLLPLKLSFALMGLALAIPVLILAVVRIEVGLILMLCLGFVTELLRKYSDAPYGIALDGFLVLLGVGMLFGLIRNRDFEWAKHPISYAIMVWMYYSFFMFFNPIAESQLAFVYTIRSLAILLFLYFIALYAIDSLDKVKLIMKTILGLAFVSALYGLKQEWFGFSNQERIWLFADEERLQLINQWGRLRIFSFFSDPTTCGIVMAYMSCMCAALFFGPYEKWKKALLVIAAGCMVLAMAYAGSRTPIAVFPAGLFFFVVLYPKRQILMVSGAIFLVGTAAMLKSSSNPVLYRIQSTFRPTEDAAFQVRLDNQALIQPYIQTHPIGAGLGTTGVWGKRFTPDSWLSSFAHDSGFVRIAVEMGYIGLIIYMGMLFVIMYTGIQQIYRVRDPVIKNLTMAIVVVNFCLVLASYPQEAITLLPTSLVFYVLLACQVRLGKIDEAQQAAAQKLEPATEQNVQPL